VLAELQSRFRHALVSGEHSDIAPLLVGGSAVEKRLRIHQRHYEASLVSALLGKFPATQWLVGSVLVREAARQFIRRHPPRVPCIAEYGSDFPSFLAECAIADRLPYLRSFGELEWYVGHVSTAIELPPVKIASLSVGEIDSILAAGLTIQPGVRYLESCWPVDELLTLYLSETAPDQFVLGPTDIFLEVRGARGEFRLNRLTAGDFGFRQAIGSGQSVGAAAELVLQSHSDFDIGAAFARLFTEGLVTSVTEPTEHLR
jgi:Putative DNA-binding domain